MTTMQQPASLRPLTLPDLTPGTFVWDNDLELPGFILWNERGTVNVQLLSLHRREKVLVWEVQHSPQFSPQGPTFQYLSRDDPALKSYLADLDMALRQQLRVARHEVEQLLIFGNLVRRHLPPPPQRIPRFPPPPVDAPRLPRFLARFFAGFRTPTTS